MRDVRHLPLRDGVVDRVIVDMPFGKRCGSGKSNQRLYPGALREMARVTRAGGRAVLLVAQRKLLLRCVDDRRWRIEREAMVNVGGLVGFVFVLDRLARAERA